MESIQKEIHSAKIINMTSTSILPITQTTATSISIADSSNLNTSITAIQSTLKVNGNADFDGDITVKGRSITESLDKIQERLAILVPNEKLEQDWEELHQLRMQYVELERKLLEKQRTFDILKKQ